MFDHRTPNVTAKEHTDNSNTANSEFNPAYSFELTGNANPTQCEVDTFDHILQVTSHHEAVYAYYYMDDDNKVKQSFSNKIDRFSPFNGLKKNVNFIPCFQVKCTKIFDLTNNNGTSSKSDGDQLPTFPDPEWDAMPTTGTNCHQCLELIWESEVVPLCICFKNSHQHDHKQDSQSSSTSNQSTIFPSSKQSNHSLLPPIIQLDGIELNFS